MHRALVLRVWRRTINGLYLRASLPVRPRLKTGKEALPVLFSSPRPGPAVTPEQKGVRVHPPSLRTSTLHLPFSEQTPLILSRKLIENRNHL